MKGQLSEAELHFLRSRMRGGILSKARRGELITPLPIGLAYDAAGHAGPDPDTSIQQAVRLWGFKTGHSWLNCDYVNRDGR